MTAVTALCCHRIAIRYDFSPAGLTGIGLKRLCFFGGPLTAGHGGIPFFILLFGSFSRHRFFRLE